MPELRVSFWRRHWLKLVASVVVTAGVVYTATSGGLKLVPEVTDFSGVRWWLLPLCALPMIAMMWFRSVRVRFLLRELADVPKLRLFAISSIGASATLLLPFRLGELVRPYLLSTRRRAPGEPSLTMTTATGAVVAERIIDGLVLSFLLAIVLLGVPTIVPLPDQVVGLPISVASVRAAGFAMLAVFAAAFVTIAVFYFARGFAHRATRAVIGLVSPRLADKLATFVDKLADGLHVLRRGRDALGFLAETLAYWAVNALAMWVLAYSCNIVHADGSPLTFAETCGLLGLLGCAIMIPGPAGLVGVFQVGIYAGMTMFVPEAIVIGPGAVYVFVLYLASVMLQLGLGAWGLWYERISAADTRQLLPDTPQSSPESAS